jgi:hypothetical protein
MVPSFTRTSGIFFGSLTGAVILAACASGDAGAPAAHGGAGNTGSTTTSGPTGAGGAAGSTTATSGATTGSSTTAASSTSGSSSGTTGTGGTGGGSTTGSTGDAGAGTGGTGTGGAGTGGAPGDAGTGAGGAGGSGGAGSTCVKANLKDCLLPGPKDGGFSQADQILWCSSVILVDGVYHMFASRWPSMYGIAGWTMYSEAVRATSTSLLGPYTFQEVVLQKRPDNWDNTRIHNVKIVKAGSKYVLFYIDTANETGFAYADAITGPWTRQDKPAMKVSNPAPFVRPDLSMYVFGRLQDSTMVNRGIAFTAPTFMGPYTVLQNGDNLLPNNYQLEDPTIWWANNQYNIVLNDWKGLATGTDKNGAQYSSKDGITYKLMSPDSVFTKTVPYDDGSSETCLRRERPFVYANEAGEAMALFTSCLTPAGPSHIVVQPANHYVPTD